MKLVAKKPFGELFVDVWQGENGEIFMTREQIGAALEYSDPSDAIRKIHDRNKKRLDKFSVTDKLSGTDGKQYETYIYSAKGIYEICRHSSQPKADAFYDWVYEAIESIRKTGGHVNNEDLFLATYLPFVDEQTQILFKTTLATVRQQNEVIKAQRETIVEQLGEIDHKEHVIIGLVDEIDLATKRQVLNRVVRKGGLNKVQQRWNELYKQFEMKYHVNLQRKLDSYNESHKPKLKNKLDYIDKVLGKIPELYEIACKIYENDVKELVSELYELNKIS
ncbi:Bro-N domain-containing protein [Paenibacillus sp. BIHB 4019]|uniref:BRO-N domain-containing protein n=1 Tax=Paenibacillus sp. BIHB 4019 TaxID=1870819 RepID=UPI001C0EE25F|nr:Bro-N domain-containing protein [Paenibacillus sp. BIHB 4019]